MVSIKLKAGMFIRQNNVIRAGDPAFEVDEATARRLVDEKGVAVYAAPFVVEQPVIEPEEPELPEGVVGIPEYSVEMKANKLREIGALCGLTFPVGMTKTEMVAALDAHIEANMVDGVEVNGDGEITVADYDAPTFDAAEAVQ